MEPAVRRKLADFLRTEGTSLTQDAQRLRGMLLDTCPESRKEVGLLIAAVEEDLPARLLRASSDPVLRDGAMAQAVATLTADRFLDQAAAQWVVRSWAWALGIVPDEPDDDVVSLSDSSRSQDLRSDSGSVTASHVSSGPPADAPTVIQLPEPTRVDLRRQPWEQTPAGASTGSVGHSAETQLPPLDPFAAPGAPQSAPGSWGQPSDGGPSSGFPVSAPNYPQYPPYAGPPPAQGLPVRPSPTKSPKWPLVVLAAAGAVVLLICISIATYSVVHSRILAGPTPAPTASPSSSPSVEASPSPTTQRVNFRISHQLLNWMSAETLKVYFYGKYFDSFTLNSGHDAGTLYIEGPAGPANYELVGVYQYYDDLGQLQQRNISGTGTIEVGEGVEFVVDMVSRGDGYEYSLHAG